MTLFSKKIDDKIRKITLKITIKLGNKKLRNLPTLTRTDAEEITNKVMKTLNTFWKIGKSITLGILLLWYFPKHKNLGYLPSITILLLITYLKLQYGTINTEQTKEE